MQMEFLSLFIDIPMRESPLQATIVDNLNEKLRPTLLHFNDREK